MIKSNSPFYISTPFVSAASGITSQNYELSVWVWDGVKASPPAAANYTTTKGNPTTSTSSDKINIARLVNDFIEFAPQKTTTTSVINGNNNQWVKTSVIYNKLLVALPQITTLTVVTPNQVGGTSPCLLTLNGVQYSVDILSTTINGNADNIKFFIDNDAVLSLLYTATVLNNIVTITAITSEVQIATSWLVGSATGMTTNVLTTQAGSYGQEAPQYATTSLMSLGYTYGNEGENITTITNNTLIPTQDYKVNREGVFVVPILVDESVVSPVTIISYPDNEINFSSNIAATTTSGELIKYLWVQCNETTADSYIEVVFNGQTTTLLLQDEPKYAPMDIFFQNKEGAEQVLTFFKEKKNSLSITSSEFESDRGQPSLGNHQFVRYNVQGREDLTLNSGFVDEDMNGIFAEMLLSERIWSYDGTNFTPLNIKSKQLSYKTQLNERLINYEMKFEYSYNQINNI